MKRIALVIVMIAILAGAGFAATAGTQPVSGSRGDLSIPDKLDAIAAEMAKLPRIATYQGTGSAELDWEVMWWSDFYPNGAHFSITIQASQITPGNETIGVRKYYQIGDDCGDPGSYCLGVWEMITSNGDYTLEFDAAEAMIASGLVDDIVYATYCVTVTYLP